MNFEDYYPGATIHNVEYLENIIIIHTEADPEKEVRTINDLPMFGKSVLIRVSEDASYEWIGVTSKTKRLNKLITSCCKSAPDEDSMEELVALNNVRCSPFEPCIIIDSNRDLYEKSSVPVPVSKRDNRGRTSTFNYELLIEALRKIEHDKGIYYYHMPSEYWITKRDELVFNDEGVVIDTNYTYRKLPEYLNKRNPQIGRPSLQTLHRVIQEYFPDLPIVSPKVDNEELYKQGSDYFSFVSWESMCRTYEYLNEEYKHTQTKPAKSYIKNTEYPARLEEIKSKEELAFTVPALELKKILADWGDCNLYTGSPRLIHAIQIKNRTLYFRLTFYDFPKEKYCYDESVLKFQHIKIDVDPAVKIYRPLYCGKPEYGMRTYKTQGALYRMNIPDDGEIEIGISKCCVRFSMPDTDYLIPTLKTIHFPV